ncbi:MAG: hypothetical protein AAGC56_10865 [Pseudomonadota bacterium]
MTNGYSFGGEEVREESSWRYPLAFFFATLVACAAFLYFYLGPDVDDLRGDTPSPAISDEIVRLTLGGVPFAIPTNHTVFPRDRRGGERDNVELYAIWPTMAGYSPTRRAVFVENAYDTPRIDIIMKRRSSPFNERQRIDNLYFNQTLDKLGEETPYQLRKYEFGEQRPNVPSNGYSATELFLGETDDGDVLALLCLRERDGVRSPPYCWREYELTPDITVTYRFKRPYLTEWRAIDARTREFVGELVSR